MEAAGKSLGIYISIPFCRSKCTYCNFASGVYPARDHARYVERLIEDLAQARNWAKSISAELPSGVDTVYLGGGTPSLLEPHLLTRLFDALHREFLIDADAEITMECAPGQISDQMLEAIASCGVNRVSLGVQSFVDREAQLGGRLHSRAIVEEDLRRLRAAGIANLNVDLLAGLAEQTFASWERSLTALIDCGVPHASVYMLEVDEDSRLGREMLAGGARYHAALVPTDDAMARMYERAMERLGEAGLEQYEISNFSRPGFQSRHNRRYWERRPYLGVGLDASSALPAAPGNREGTNGSASGHESSHAHVDPALVSGHDSSRTHVDPARVSGHESSRTHADPAPVSGHEFTRAGNGQKKIRALAPEENCDKAFLLRATTTDDLKAYLVSPQPPEMTWLMPQQQHEEAWFLGLRLNAGVDIAAVEREFGANAVAAAIERVEHLVDEGLLARDAMCVRLTPHGRLISNDVFQEFLDLVPGSVDAQQRG